jgi:hypothetical protein
MCPNRELLKTSPARADETSAASMRRRPRRKAFDALIGLVFIALAGYGIYRYHEEIFEAFYGPTAMIVMVIMVLEFLVLKSFDRTRLYRLENERLVRRRVEDIKAIRGAEAVLAQLLGEPPFAAGAASRPRASPNTMIEEPEPAPDEGEAMDTPLPPLSSEGAETELEPDAQPPDADTGTGTDTGTGVIPPGDSREEARHALQSLRRRLR